MGIAVSVTPGMQDWAIAIVAWTVAVVLFLMTFLSITGVPGAALLQRRWPPSRLGPWPRPAEDRAIEVEILASSTLALAPGGAPHVELKPSGAWTEMAAMFRLCLRNRTTRGAIVLSASLELVSPAYPGRVLLSMPLNHSEDDSPLADVRLEPDGPPVCMDVDNSVGGALGALAGRVDMVLVMPAIVDGQRRVRRELLRSFTLPT